MLYIKVRGYPIDHQTEFGSSGQPIPTGIHPIHQVLHRLLSVQRLEKLYGRTALTCCTEALAFMLRATLRSDFSIRLTAERMKLTDINLKLLRGCIVLPPKISRVPHQSFGLPNFGMRQLFRKAIGISRRLKSLYG